MRRYETVVIVPVDLPDDEITGLIDRYRSIITNHRGTAIKVEKWGKRKLAYEIRKHNKGFYMLIDFAGQSATVVELERNLKIDDKVLKFMTVKKNDHVVLADLEKEIAAGLPAAVAAEAENRAADPAAGGASQTNETVEAKTAQVQEGGA